MILIVWTQPTTPAYSSIKDARRHIRCGYDPQGLFTYFIGKERLNHRTLWHYVNRTKYRRTLWGDP